MENFDYYTSAFESMVHDVDELMGRYLIEDFMATESIGSSIKDAVQTIWRNLMEMLDRFRTFISTKFKAARSALKKLIPVFKKKAAEKSNDDDDALDEETKKTLDNFEQFCEHTERLTKQAEKIANECDRIMRGDANEVSEEDFDAMIRLVDEFFGYKRGEDGELHPIEESFIGDPAMEGVGNIFRMGSRIIDMIIKADNLMRAVENITYRFHQFSSMAKQKFNGDEPLHKKIAAKIQRLVSRVLGALSSAGKRLAGLPNFLISKVRKATGHVATAEKYDGPDPFKQS